MIYRIPLRRFLALLFGESASDVLRADMVGLIVGAVMMLCADMGIFAHCRVSNDYVEPRRRNMVVSLQPRNLGWRKGEVFDILILRKM